MSKFFDDLRDSKEKLIDDKYSKLCRESVRNDINKNTQILSTKHNLFEIKKSPKPNVPDTTNEDPLKMTDKKFLDSLEAEIVPNTPIQTKQQLSKMQQLQLNTELFLAAESGATDKVKELLFNGAEINVRNKYGNTPLIRAAMNGRTKTAELLLNHGADINAKDNCLDTSLMWVAWHGHTKTAELLLINGADPALKNIDGNTAEKIARDRGYSELADILKNTERKKVFNDVNEHLEHQQRIHDALRRKDPLTMTDGEFLDSLEAEITDEK